MSDWGWLSPGEIPEPKFIPCFELMIFPAKLLSPGLGLCICIVLNAVLIAQAYDDLYAFTTGSDRLMGYVWGPLQSPSQKAQLPSHVLI